MPTAPRYNLHMDTNGIKKILIDFDNTVGISGRPMDDALALLYLLGCHSECEIVGICTNYGNGTAEECYNATVSFLDEIGYSHIPLHRGREIAGSYLRDKTGFDIADNDEVLAASSDVETSDAARFIAATIDEHAGEIIYLSLGSTVNLYEASQIDSSIYDKLSQIVMMGGITEPLYIHGVPLGELNLSVNARASADVLTRGHNITIITGNNCLPVSALPKKEFLDNLCSNEHPSGMYIAKKCGYRFHDKETTYGADSSYCWDGVAAAYILHPELFEDSWTDCNINEADLKTGFLNPCSPAQANCTLNLPSAIDRVTLQQEFYRGWLELSIGTHYADYACTGLYLDKLIQPCVLIELSRGECHGFLLLQKLKAQGCVEQSLDPTGFYRNLKKMEKDGYLTSRKDETSPRNKRIFTITDFGRHALLNWQDSLRKYTMHINRIISSIDDVQ